MAVSILLWLFLHCATCTTETFRKNHLYCIGRARCNDVRLSKPLCKSLSAYRSMRFFLVQKGTCWMTCPTTMFLGKRRPWPTFSLNIKVQIFVCRAAEIFTHLEHDLSFRFFRVLYTNLSRIKSVASRPGQPAQPAGRQASGAASPAQQAEADSRR